MNINTHLSNNNTGDYMSYIFLFISKTIENILATLRIIVLSNHKKLLAAALNSLIALIWIFSTISVLRNFSKEPMTIIIYILGCFIGSYLGGYIEEKVALGDNMLTCITSEDSFIAPRLREAGYLVTVIDGYGIDYNQKVLLIMVPRRKKYKISKLIKLIDNKATIISESANYFDNK